LPRGSRGSLNTRLVHIAPGVAGIAEHIYDGGYAPRPFRRRVVIEAGYDIRRDLWVNRNSGGRS
jgi:hypothetical protein